MSDDELGTDALRRELEIRQEQSAELRELRDEVYDIVGEYHKRIEDIREELHEETDSTEETTVRERKGRTFFVGEKTLDKIDAKYKELDAKWYAEYGEDLPKNKEFYPALFEAIDWDDVEENLLGEE
jgi:uncharacterized coiled-coil DUF342 family protein